MYHYVFIQRILSINLAGLIPLYKSKKIIKMKLKTFIIILIISLNHLFSQIEITIYNENKAFINETRELILNEIGEQHIIVDNLPNDIEPSSISMFSENIKFISKVFLNKSIEF